MSDTNSDGTSNGSELPSLSDDHAKAFAEMEAAANAEKATLKGQGGQTTRLGAPEPDEEPAPTPTPAPAPSVAAPAPTPAPAAQPAAAAPAPQPAPAPAPPPPGAVPAADDEPGAVLANDGKRYVPLDALTGERRTLQGKVKDVEAALAEERKRNQTLMEALGQRGQSQPAAQPAAAPAPAEPEKNPFDKNTHPLEHLEWKNEQLEKSLGEIANWRKGQEDSVARSQAEREARTAYSTMHNQFVAQNPTYDGPDGAYRWMMNKWTAVHEALGMNRPQAVAAANQMEWSIVQQAAQANVNPSSMLMKVAEAAGWTPPAAPTPGAQPGATTVAGAVPAATPTPQQTITLAQQGAAAAISLSDAAGGTPPALPTLAALANMSKEEYAATMAANPRLFDKLAYGKAGSAAA